MPFTETWLTELTLDANIVLDGFQIRCADRTKESCERKGGGPAVFITGREQVRRELSKR